MAYLGADLSQTKEQQSFDPVPPGDYHVTIIDSVVVETKTPGKHMLKVVFSVVDGPFAERKIFDNFVLGNEAAMSRMKSMAIASQHKSPDFIQDSEELHGLKLIIKVKVSTDPGYPPQNKITRFKKLEGTQTPVAPPVFAPPPASPIAPQMQAPKPTPTTPSFTFAAPAQAPQTQPPVAASAVPQEKTAAVNPPAKLPWE